VTTLPDTVEAVNAPPLGADEIVPDDNPGLAADNGLAAVGLRSESLAGLKPDEKHGVALAVATLMVRSAAEDETFHSKEREAAHSLLARFLDLTPELAEEILIKGEAASQTETLYSASKMVKEQLSEADRAQLIEILKHVVAADGFLHDFEEGVLHRLAVFLDVPFDLTEHAPGSLREVSTGASETASDFAKCLVPLLDTLGWRGNSTQLSEALPHVPEEMGQTEFLNTLANLKFEGQLTQTRMHRIDPRLMPCLFVPKRGAAKVLVAPGSNRGLLVYDGDTGEYSQIKRRRTRGTAIMFRGMRSGAPSFLRQQTDWFRKVILRFRSLFGCALVLSLLLSIMAMMVPIFVMVTYNQLNTAGSIYTLQYLGAGVGIFILADTGFKFLRSRVFRFASVRLGNIIGNEVVRRILYLPPAYTESANLGAQVARIRDFETVREFFGGPALVAVVELPFMALLIACLFFIGGAIGFVPIIAIVLFAVFGLLMAPVINRANGVTAQAGSVRQSFVVETLSNLRAIKTSGVADTWKERYRELSAEAIVAGFETAKLTAIVNAASQTVTMTAGLATMAVGAFSVAAGSMTAGALLASMILVWRVLAPIKTGFTVLSQLGRIRKSIAQVNRLMNMPLEDRSETTTSISRTIKGKVSFSRVSIRYTPDSHPALIGADFSVEPGETLLILGHDGAGKSTILKLIMGLYQSQAGRILIDDTNIRQLDPVALRHDVAYAPQGTYEFYGTIRQNLLLAYPPATDKDLEDAAAKAGVLDDVRALPGGFDTRIGDHNSGHLSAILRRRLGLARVFLRRANLMLLDEPELGAGAALLDTLSELKGKTTLVICTHDQRFFGIADKVLWLESGRTRMYGPASEVCPKFIKERRGTAKTAAKQIKRSSGQDKPKMDDG